MNKKKKNNKRMPDWAPDNADSKFASRIISGDKGQSKTSKVVIDPMNQKVITDIDDLFSGILASDRTKLSQAITLIESNSPKHFEKSQELVKKLIPYSGKSLRIGITGVPGAGKSTFIETFGTFLIEHEHKVAVLAIDPSSTISKGSILGDKTRMEKLARSESSFIRPSPTSGVLGGVARKTRESVIALEAAGYDVVLIETVGVGQSEVTVRSIVDFFLLMQITGAGDDLQGIKKGTIELADLIVVNKADGDNLTKAEYTVNEINQILHYIQPVSYGWETIAMDCSALTGYNLENIWKTIQKFSSVTKNNGGFDERRSNQKVEWLNTMLFESVSNLFFNDNELVAKYQTAKQEILTGEISPSIAVKQLIELFKKKV